MLNRIYSQLKTNCVAVSSDIKQKGRVEGSNGAEASASSRPSGNSTSCEKGCAKTGTTITPDEPRQTSISQNEPAAGSREDIPLQVEAKFAVLLLRCLKSLQFNTHETACWDEQSEKDNSVGLGGGLYPTLALFNHSCSPSIVRYVMFFLYRTQN